MKSTVLLISLFALLQSVFSQIPQVPSKMKFADLQLTITKSGRHKIQKEVDKLRKNDAYFRKYVKKADLYFPVIEQAFKEEGCPEDIKYLVIQESGMNPVAVSSSNAVGYWQFKKATGVEQGLKISQGIDERKNINASSHAAGQYMVGNNKRINNWIYTVMAYQRGVGGAQQYIKDKYRGAKKMEINSQTYWYVIKFLAHKVAYENEVGKVKHEQKLLVIESSNTHSVKQVAKKHGLSLEEVKPYNEWIGLSKKIPSDKVYSVILPMKNDGKKGNIPMEGQVATYEETQENYDSQSDILILTIPEMTKLVIINDRPAVIPSESESVVTLARKGEITQKKFRKYNELESFSDVIAGMPYFFRAKKSKAKVPYHTVKAGESTWSIAQKYGMKEWSLKTKNRIGKREALVLGRVLWLNKTRPNDVAIQIKPIEKVITPVVEEKEESNPIKVEEQAVIETKKEIEVEKSTAPIAVGGPLVTLEENDQVNSYVVNQGDTYYGISRKFGISVEQLKKLNKLTDEELAVGQVLKIKNIEDIVKPKVDNDVTENEFFEYQVQEGDTMYGVSKKFNVSVDDILKWNKKSTNRLSLGEKIKIKK